jgi:hypothetical protein
MNIICIYHCVANGYKTYHSIYGGRKIQTKPACFDNLITENRVWHKKTLITAISGAIIKLQKKLDQ